MTDRNESTLVRRSQSGAIRGAIEEWLPVELDGADGVRRALALRLATELDAPDVAPYALARIVNALGGIIGAIEGTDSTEGITTGELDVRALKALLREAVR